jgi:hypothetical protein
LTLKQKVGIWKRLASEKQPVTSALKSPNKMAKGAESQLSGDT